MRFYSKQANYRVVLRPSMPGNRLTGDPGKSGISVRFENGIADVDDEKTIGLMMKATGYKNKDFISADDRMKDDGFPIVKNSTEPIHNTIEMKYGSPVGGVSGTPNVKFSVAQKKVMADLVNTTVKEMLKDTLKDYDLVPKAKRGRPAKEKGEDDKKSDGSDGSDEGNGEKELDNINLENSKE